MEGRTGQPKKIMPLPKQKHENTGQNLPSFADEASLSTTMLKQWMNSCDAVVT